MQVTKKNLIKTQNLNGITLVELVVSLAIATIAITILLQSTDIISKINRFKNQTKAYHTAAQKIEELRNTPFNNLPPSGPFTANGFAGQLTINNYSDSNIKQVTVTVFWQDHSTTRQVQLDTLISKFGLNP